MLETVLERIAVALEKQNEMTAQLLMNKPAGAVPVVATPPAAAPKVEKKAPKAAPVITPEPVEVDPFESEAEAPGSSITIESLMAHLTEHAKKFGNKVTIDLIKRHGADAVTPKIKTIPEANWKACWDEAAADLAKVTKK